MVGSPEKIAGRVEMFWKSFYFNYSPSLTGIMIYIGSYTCTLIIIIISATHTSKDLLTTVQ